MNQTESLENATSFDQSETRFALRCWSNNDMYNADFDYALVVVNDATRSIIRRRRDILKYAAAMDSDVTTIDFYDSRPEYFCESTIGDFEIEDSGNQEIADLLNGGEVAIMPASFTTPEDTDGSFRTECDRMVICETGIHWNCSPKHSSILVETAELNWKELGIDNA